MEVITLPNQLCELSREIIYKSQTYLPETMALAEYSLQPPTGPVIATKELVLSELIFGAVPYLQD